MRNAMIPSLGSQIETAMTDAGVAVPKTDHRHVVAIISHRKPSTDLTVDATQYMTGWLVVGPKADRTDIDTRAAFQDATRCYGWKFKPFRMSGNEIVERGSIVNQNRQLVLHCASCGNIYSLWTNINREVVCDRCRVRGGAKKMERVTPRVPESVYQQLYEAWGNLPDTYDLNFMPRVWGVYRTQDLPLAGEIQAWSPAAHDTTAQVVAQRAAAAPGGPYSIRPLGAVLEEQEICKAEKKASKLVKLVLEAPCAWTLGWIDMLRLWGLKRQTLEAQYVWRHPLNNGTSI